jgi:hypothetical protein
MAPPRFSLLNDTILTGKRMLIGQFGSNSNLQLSRASASKMRNEINADGVSSAMAAVFRPFRPSQVDCRRIDPVAGDQLGSGGLESRPCLAREY